ncbi:hypothetical protein [Stenotrophomonas phage RAS14]
MSNITNFRPNYFFQWSRRVPHIAEADIEGNGVGVAIAVVAINPNNKDLLYIRLDRLDDIDLRRLTQILQTRDSARWPLFDLLLQKTLPNGQNAMEFFHQLVRVRTVTGITAGLPGQTTGGSGVSLHQMFGLGAGYRGPAGAGQAAFASHLESAPVEAPGAVAEYDDEEGYDQTDIGHLDAYSHAPVDAVKKKPGRPRKNG